MTSVLKNIAAVALALALSAAAVFGFAGVVNAQADLSSDLETVGSNSDLATSDLTETLGTLISAFVAVLGIVLLVLIIYAGFLWMTAGGNPDQVGKAKTIMINAVIGLVILLAAYSISIFVINALADAGLTS